jgi:hypothetical protein
MIDADVFILIRGWDPENVQFVVVFLGGKATSREARTFAIAPLDAE